MLHLLAAMALGAGPQPVWSPSQREALRRDIEASFAAIPPRSLPTPQVQQSITQLLTHLRELYHLDEGALAGLDADLV